MKYGIRMVRNLKKLCTPFVHSYNSFPRNNRTVYGGDGGDGGGGGNRPDAILTVIFILGLGVSIKTKKK